MKKPNWVCSNCSMWSSRKSSVKRHIQNVHGGNATIVSFIDYIAGRKSGFYFPNPRPTYEKGISTTNTTVTVLDTFKGEVWKAVATKAANKVLYPSSSAGVNQQQYLSNFQGFGNNGAPYFYPSQSYFEPLHIIPRPEDIFGFEIYVCKKCSSIEPIIVSFNDGQEGGSKMSWATCCGSSDLKKVDQKNLNDNNELQQKIQNKLKDCVDIWTIKKPRLVAIKIPKGDGNSVRLLQEGTHKSISLEFSSEKNIDLDIDVENHWATRCVRSETTALSDDNFLDFLSKTKNTTFGFFTVKIKESNSVYLMAILNDNVARRLRLA